MPTLRHLLQFLLAPLLATAELRWSVQSWRSVADFNGDPWDESEYVYLLSNLSTPGDANNLISFTVPAGSDRGVYSAAAPTGWDPEILPDCTLFHNNGNYIAPNDSNNFYLYSTLIGTGSGWADGWSDLNGPFPPFSVQIPAALPPRLTALASATNGVWLGLADLVVPRSSNTVLRAASPTGTWDAVVTFPGASLTTNLWLPGAAPRAFFRVRSEQW
ncbi:MAG: hypothetical protein PHR35_12545 [Kiritimatiellae bacterium]|nr:hypothetical protein [Kiritimatiellia bacterium]